MHEAIDSVNVATETLNLPAYLLTDVSAKR